MMMMMMMMMNRRAKSIEKGGGKRQKNQSEGWEDSDSAIANVDLFFLLVVCLQEQKTAIGFPSYFSFAIY